MALPHVVVLGAAAVDLVARVEQLPRRDGIVLARSYERFPGGSPANVAVGLARLGLRVGFLGKMGDDEHGRLLLESFDQEGVDRQGVIVETGRPTSTCFIALDDRGERMIVALPGVAVIERPDELDPDHLRRAQALYMGPSYAEVAAVAAAVTHEGGGTVFYAPGGVRGPEDLEALRLVIDQADVLVVSRTEAMALTGVASPEDAVRALQGVGVSVVVETLGQEGALVASDARLVRVPAFEVPDVVDTTGAGDAFAAGLIAGFLEGLEWESAARVGCAGAALKIRHLGARSGLPSREQVQSLIEDAIL